MPARVRVVAVAASLLVAASACGDGEPSDQRADQASDAADAAGLSEEVQDFFALAATAATSTYTVRYAATAPEPGQPDRQITIAQRPPDRRLEVVNPDGTVDLSLQTGGVGYQCRQTDGSWLCEEVADLPPVAAGAFDPAAVGAAVDALRAVADDYEFVIETRTLAGVDATCLVTTLLPEREDDESLGSSGALCVSAEGVALLVERPGERLSASSYTTEVEDGMFELPA